MEQPVKRQLDQYVSALIEAEQTVGEKKAQIEQVLLENLPDCIGMGLIKIDWTAIRRRRFLHPERG